ncbi:DUF6083 domain-containing protein [Streptomyces sp. UNOB3_S3]|uniref:DUF6083 domain-containing protein n=1 Tax=Streptomyces sp. UNOB3_S3 TaxID=2871682 RepID=UPI001E552C5D|nr:DUF6083 domain-containing protein [Streptomyces sp. UNOB3_S3]
MGVNNTTRTVACPECGWPQQLRRTPGDRWILLEFEPLPSAEVPQGQRWLVTPGGWASTGPEGEPLPGGYCYIAHHHVCSRRTYTNDMPDIYAVTWSRNRARDGLPIEGIASEP